MDPITLLFFLGIPLLFWGLNNLFQPRQAAGGAPARPRSLGDIIKALGPAGTQVGDYRSVFSRVDSEEKRLLLSKGVQSDPSRVSEAQRALEEYLRLDATAAERAAIQLLLGNRHYEVGELAEAEQSYRQAIAAAEEAEEPQVKSTALGNLGLLLARENPQQARLYLEEALALDRGLGYKAGVMNHLAALGRLYQDQGDSGRALTLAQQALETQEAMNVSRHWADALGNLALVYLAQRELGNAQACLEQALQIERDLSSVAGEAACLDNLGFIYQERNELSRALQLHQQAQILFEGAGASDQAQVTGQRIAALKQRLEAPSS